MTIKTRAEIYRAVKSVLSFVLAMMGFWYMLAKGDHQHGSECFLIAIWLMVSPT